MGDSLSYLDNFLVYFKIVTETKPTQFCNIILMINITIGGVCGGNLK